MISHCKLRYVICKLPSILPRRVTLAYYQSRKELFTFRLFFCSLYFLFFFGTEKKAKELVLSSGAVESLQSRTDALSVVVPILDKLQLSQEALTNPVPETTGVVRCLARIAKREKSHRRSEAFEANNFSGNCRYFVHYFFVNYYSRLGAIFFVCRRQKNSAFITRVLRMTNKSEIVVMTRMSSKLTNLKLIACLSFVAITSRKIWPIYFPNRLILLNISSFDSNDYFRPSKSFLGLHSLRQSTIDNRQSTIDNRQSTID